MDHRQVVRMLAAGRVVVGASLLLTPGFAGGLWLGAPGRQREVKVMTRSMGVRDLALGTGTLHALETGEPVRSWVAMSALSDAVDLAATALAVRRLGWRRALPTMVVAGTCAALGALAIDRLD